MKLIAKGIKIERVDILPEYIKETLKKNGITRLREFQIKGIEKGLEGENLIVTSPTGSGKTLIGEIISIIKVREENKKVLYLVPYKALAEEVKETFSKRYPFVNIGIATGDYREVSNERLGKIYDVIIVTYEKADSILRDKPTWLKKLGLIIIDEIHLLGEYERGPILDIILTKVKEMNLQIVGLSATIPNPEDIANWLNAKLIKNNQRPVKLLEGVYVESNNKTYFYDPNPKLREIYLIPSRDTPNPTQQDGEKNLQYFLEKMMTKKGKKIKIEKIELGEAKKIEREYYRDKFCEKIEKRFQNKIGKGKIVYDNVEKAPTRSSRLMYSILTLIYDLFTKMQKYHTTWQILIFRKSRKLTQLTAKKVAEMLKKTGINELFPEAPKISTKLLENVEETTPLTEELAEYLRFGVAFHHAGLSKEERQVIENAFRERKIGVIIATPTLAAGINLPARRVVIEHSMYSKTWGDSSQISVAHYKQRSGRAGRPGLDIVGESILIAHSTEDALTLFETYIFGELEDVKSFLGVNLPILRSQILALIVTEGNPSIKEINTFFQNSFFYYISQKDGDPSMIKHIERNIIYSVRELEDWGFVKIDEMNEKVTATKVGIATSKLYLDPLSAVEIVKMLEYISRKKDLSPISIFKYLNHTPDVAYYRLKIISIIKRASDILTKVPSTYQRLLEKEFGDDLFQFFNYLSDGFYINLTPNEEEELGSLVLTAMLLQWIEEKPIKEILDNLTPNFGAGDFIEFIRTCERLLYSARELSKVVKASKKITKYLDKLRKRVQHGVREELLVLTEIPSVGRVRAKILYNNGFTDLEKIAKVDYKVLARLPTIGETTARKIVEYAKNKVPN
ncbi:MAG: DEAD/DEAH box helicase [Candidatus Njordarchaeia archaeon]